MSPKRRMLEEGFFYLLITIACTLVFNEPALLVSRFGYVELIGAAAVFFALLIAIGLTRLSFVLLLPMLLLITAAVWILAEGFNLNPSSNLLAAFIETNVSEATEQLSARTLLIAGLVILTSSLLCITHWKLLSRPANRRFHLTRLAFGVFLVAAIFTFAPRQTLYEFHPFNLVEPAKSYWVERANLVANSNRRFDISTLESSFDEKGNDLSVVLILGESARPDHFQINGYGRKTTPGLDRLKGLINFGSVRTCAVVTRVAVPCLMTRSTHEDPSASISETSFISLFNKHGFTSEWISMNDVLGIHNTPTSIIAREADHRWFRDQITSEYSEANDSLLLNYVRPSAENRLGKRLTVLHSRGSHALYTNRYPPTFERFKPTCAEYPPISCNQASFINAYDNTIAFTDHFITQVIDLYKEKNAIVFYTSDHGESIGEDGYYGHGDEGREEQRMVPLIIWASDRYIANNPRAFSAMQANRDRALSHDNIFHSILHCAGISGAVIDSSQSVCAAPQVVGTYTLDLF